MLTAVLTVAAFTLVARGACEPFILDPQLETDCSGPPAENKIAAISDVSYPFRTDYLTLHEGKAYEQVPCSPTQYDSCHVHYYGNTDRDKRLVSPFHRTYFELDCTGYSFEDSLGGWRPFVRAYTKKFSTFSPKRALIMKIRERSDIKDPIHSDVFEPVRGQVIDLTVLAGASNEVTSKIYNIGILPSLVALRIESGMNLSVRRHDFNRIPNVRLILFHTSTITEMEPYTFTDLPHLGSLSVDMGLYYMFNQMAEASRWRVPARGTWIEADLDKIHRIHCDCSFAWFRNFLSSKPQLIEFKTPGTMAVIGNYMSAFFNGGFGFDSYVASLDCAKNLTRDNYQAGNQYSHNTTCFGSC